tara:strand:- start:39037 stop:40098 length:1062 start_codon:yes stop_codon:yes gene_type:complete
MDTTKTFEAGWLDGPAYDSVLIFGVAAIALISGGIVIYNPDLFYPVLLVDIWLLGYHHVIATFTKLAGTKEDRKENSFLIYWLPLLVLSGVIGLYQVLGIWSIVTVYFFWQWFHYTRQSYGIGRFYRRKALLKTNEPEWLTHLAVWSIPVWGILHRSSQGWEEFLFLPLYIPLVPERVVFLASLVVIGSVVLWLYYRVRDYMTGNLSLPETYFTASHMVIFYVGYVAISEINVGWLVANIWHNAQYILFVWLYNTKRFGVPVGHKEPVTILAWLSQRKPIRILLYFCFTLACTTIFYQSLSESFQWLAAGNAVLLSTLYIVSYQTINFHHYVVDGLIWKVRKKQHRQVMQLRN